VAFGWEVLKNGNSPLFLERVMKFKVFAIVLGLFGGSVSVWAVTPPKQIGPVDDVGTYQRAMAQMELLVSRGKPVSERVFKRFNWTGRTAALNYVCSAQGLDDCRKVLALGLSDKALVVRDHALRIVLASDGYLKVEKAQIARDVLEDPRNYRSGAPLWIIDRARKYLEGLKG
jgi:hypothetical protein